MDENKSIQNENLEFAKKLGLEIEKWELSNANVKLNKRVCNVFLDTLQILKKLTEKVWRLYGL